MIFNYFYKLFFWSKLNEYRVVNKILIRLFNHLIPQLWMLSPIKPKLKGCENKYIVSLTTIPNRIDKVWITIESILRQSEKPDKIILWLFKGDFETYQSIPGKLLKQQKRGLEIRFCDEDLKPHKKYYYSLISFPNSFIITIDDDFIYPRDFVRNLKIVQNEYPNEVICSISRKISCKENRLDKYKNWKFITRQGIPSFSTLIMGGTGCLIHKSFFHDDLFNKELIYKYALTTDDLWLKLMSIRKNIKTISLACHYKTLFVPIIFKNNLRLMDVNLDLNFNDEVAMNLIDRFKINILQFKD